MIQGLEGLGLRRFEGSKVPAFQKFNSFLNLPLFQGSKVPIQASGLQGSKIPEFGHFKVHKGLRFPFHSSKDTATHISDHHISMVLILKVLYAFRFQSCVVAVVCSGCQGSMIPGFQEIRGSEEGKEDEG